MTHPDKKEMTPEEREELLRKLFGWNLQEFNKESFDEYVQKLKEEHEDEYLGKAIELMMAGWTAEPIRKDLLIMSWYWRRPAKKGRSKGRLFLSTDQALNNLKKLQTPSPKGEQR